MARFPLKIALVWLALSLAANSGCASEIAAPQMAPPGFKQVEQFQGLLTALSEAIEASLKDKQAVPAEDLERLIDNFEEINAEAVPLTGQSLIDFEVRGGKQARIAAASALDSLHTVASVFAANEKNRASRLHEASCALEKTLGWDPAKTRKFIDINFHLIFGPSADAPPELLVCRFAPGSAIETGRQQVASIAAPAPAPTPDKLNKIFDHSKTLPALVAPPQTAAPTQRVKGAAIVSPSLGLKTSVPPEAPAPELAAPKAEVLTAASGAAARAWAALLPWKRRELEEAERLEALSQNPRVKAQIETRTVPIAGFSSVRTVRGFSIAYADGSTRFSDFDSFMIKTSGDSQTVEIEDKRSGSYSLRMPGEERPGIEWHREAGLIKVHIGKYDFYALPQERLTLAPDGMGIESYLVDASGRERKIRSLTFHGFVWRQGKATIYHRDLAQGKDHEAVEAQTEIDYDPSVLSGDGEPQLSLGVLPEFIRQTVPDDERLGVYARFLQALPSLGGYWANYGDVFSGKTVPSNGGARRTWVKRIFVRNGRLHLLVAETLVSHEGVESTREIQRWVGEVQNGKLRIEAYDLDPSGGAKLGARFLGGNGAEQLHYSAIARNPKTGADEITAYQNFERRTDGSWSAGDPHPIEASPLYNAAGEVIEGALSVIGYLPKVAVHGEFNLMWRGQAASDLNLGLHMLRAAQSMPHGKENGTPEERKRILSRNELLRTANEFIFQAAFELLYARYTQHRMMDLFDHPPKTPEEYAAQTKTLKEVFASDTADLDPKAVDLIKIYLKAQIEEDRQKQRRGELRPDDDPRVAPDTEAEVAWMAAQTFGLSNFGMQYFRMGQDLIQHEHAVLGALAYAGGAAVIGGEAWAEGKLMGLGLNRAKLSLAARGTGLTARDLDAAVKAGGDVQGALGAEGAAAVSRFNDYTKIEMAALTAPGAIGTADAISQAVGAWVNGDHDLVDKLHAALASTAGWAGMLEGLGGKGSGWLADRFAAKKSRSTPTAEPAPPIKAVEKAALPEIVRRQIERFQKIVKNWRGPEARSLDASLRPSPELVDKAQTAVRNKTPFPESLQQALKLQADRIKTSLLSMISERLQSGKMSEAVKSDLLSLEKGLADGSIIIRWEELVTGTDERGRKLEEWEIGGKGRGARQNGKFLVFSLSAFGIHPDILAAIAYHEGLHALHFNGTKEAAPQFPLNDLGSLLQSERDAHLGHIRYAQWLLERLGFDPAKFDDTPANRAELAARIGDKDSADYLVSSLSARRFVNGRETLWEAFASPEFMSIYRRIYFGIEVGDPKDYIKVFQGLRKLRDFLDGHLKGLQIDKAKAKYEALGSEEAAASPGRRAEIAREKAAIGNRILQKTSIEDSRGSLDIAIDNLSDKLAREITAAKRRRSNSSRRKAEIKAKKAELDALQKSSSPEANKLFLLKLSLAALEHEQNGIPDQNRIDALEEAAKLAREIREAATAQK